MKDVFELAKRYYPNLWGKKQIEALLKGDKITQDEYNQIVDEDDDNN